MTCTEICHWLFAAGLGASFYGLINAMPHIKERTFDPDHTGYYVLRFVLGLVAGVVLAVIGEAALEGSDGDLAERLSPGLLALLGGFSAEAVEKVLNRLVEVLTAAVQGTEGARVRKEFDDQARAILADPKTPQPMRDSLKALLDRLR